MTWLPGTGSDSRRRRSEMLLASDGSAKHSVSTANSQLNSQLAKSKELSTGQSTQYRRSGQRKGIAVKQVQQQTVPNPMGRDDDAGLPQQAMKKVNGTKACAVNRGFAVWAMVASFFVR